jgi:hypothetical protein
MNMTSDIADRIHNHQPSVVLWLYSTPLNVRFYGHLNIFTKPHSCFWATGWKVKAAYALDRGKLTGNSNGFMLGISKSGWLIK